MINDKSDLKKAPKSATSLFFSGVLALTVANLLVKAVGLISKIALNRVVGSIGAGYYSSAYEIYAYLYVISTAGLPVALSIMVAKSRSKNRFLESKKIFDVALLLFLAIGFFFSIFMIIFSKQLANLIGAPNTSLCIVAIAPTILFICISSCLRGYFQGYQMMTPTAISQLIEAFCKVGIGVSFALWAKSKGYADYVVASYTILGVTIGVFFGMVYLYVSKMLFKEKYYFDNALLDKESIKTSKIISEMLKIAIPITLSSSVLSLTTILDTVMVQKRLLRFGMDEISVRIFYGDYTSLVISMFTLPTIFLYPIANALVPVITTAHEKNDLIKEEKMRFFSIRVVVMIALPCAIGLSLFSKPILSLLMFKPDSVERAAPWLSIASLSVLFLGIISITNSFLNSVGKQRLPIISMLSGAAIKLVSNYYLLGKIGIYGAPVSTVLCYIVASTLNIYFVVKYVGPLPKITDVLAKPFACAIFSIGLSALFYYLAILVIPTKIATILAILVASIMYFLSILMTKAITVDEISMIPKGEKIIKILKKLKIFC